MLIVDDDPMVRAGLTMMLDGAASLRVVGEAGDGSEVPTRWRSTTPTSY